MLNPLGVMPGVKTAVVIRGLKLDQATEVRVGDWKDAAKIVKKGAATVPKPLEPAKTGDQQVEVEITLPADAPLGSVNVVVITPDGETAPQPLLVDAPGSLVDEKEPNNGFREAQAIDGAHIVQGSIQQPQDVDVFRYDGEAGEKVAFEIVAARQGSALDSILTLFDGKQRILAVNDDHGGSPDSLLEFTLPAKGPYFVSVQDAHDLGGNSHPYRLIVRSAK